MNRKELISGLISNGIFYVGEHPSGRKSACSLLRWLARNGFAASEHGYAYATAATPLALLTPSCLKCAEILAGWPQRLRWVVSSDIKHFDTLEDEGLATLGSHECHPTEKLIAAIKCWNEAKESRS